MTGTSDVRAEFGMRRSSVRAYDVVGNYTPDMSRLILDAARYRFPQLPVRERWGMVA